MGPDGRFLDEGAISKTGMDYAEFLTKKKPAAEPAKEAPPTAEEQAKEQGITDSKAVEEAPRVPEPETLPTATTPKAKPLNLSFGTWRKSSGRKHLPINGVPLEHPSTYHLEETKRGSNSYDIIEEKYVGGRGEKETTKIGEDLSVNEAQTLALNLIRDRIRNIDEQRNRPERLLEAPPEVIAKSETQRPHKVTGLTPSQAQFIAAETKKIGEGGIDAAIDRLPARLKIGNLDLLVRTPEGASALHRAATGDPLPGIRGRAPSEELFGMFVDRSKDLGPAKIPTRPRKFEDIQNELAAENAAEIASRRGGKPALDAALEEVLKDSLDRGVKGIDEVTLKDRADEALKRILRGGSPSAFGVGYFQDYAIVGADLIHRGAKSLGEFTGKLVSTFGEGIRAAARGIYDAAQRIISSFRGGTAAAPTEAAPAPAAEAPARQIKPIPPGAKPGEKVAPAPAPAERAAGFNPRETGPAEVPRPSPAQKEKMAEAGAAEGGPPIEGKPSPTKEGEPEFDINVGKSSVNPETQQFLARMVDAVPERYGKTEGGARGAERTWDSVRAWATMHGWNLAELKKSFEQKGGFLSDVEMERANQLREHHRERYLEHYGQYEKLSKAGRGEEAEVALDKAKAEVAQIDALQYALTHSKSEAARSLAYAARLAEGLTPEERFIAKTFKGFRGQDALYREFAEAARKKDYKRVNEITRELHKPTLMQQIVEGWKLGALSGPPTHIVNIASTGIKTSVIDPFEASFAGILDSVMHPKDRTRYTGEGKAMLRGAWAAKNKAWTQLKQELYDMTANWKEYEDMLAGKELRGEAADTGKFGPTSGALPGKFGKAYRTVFHVMRATDQFWKDIAGAQAVHRFGFREGMQKGLRGEALEQHLQEFVRKYADKELPNQAEIAALVRRAEQTGTFNVPLKEASGPIPVIGRAMSQLTEKYPLLGIIAPFIQTPVNIAGETIARTPLGIIKLWKNRGKDSGESMDQLAKVMLGTTLMANAYLAMKTGLVEVSGGGPTDPDKKQNKIDTGWQPYSVKFGDSWVSYQRLEPLSSLLGFVADAVEAKDAHTIGEGFGKAQASIMENLTNKTFLAGLIQFSDMLSDPSRNFKSWAKQIEGSLVPAVAAKAAAALDPTVRISDPYKRKYGVPEPILARIPGASTLLEPRKTPTGEERQRAGGAAARFLSPFPISEEKGTAEADVQREFDRLSYVPEQPRRVRMLSGGKKIELDDREYALLQDVYSEAASRAAKVIKSANYKRLDPEEQEEALKRIYREAARRGRMRLYQDQKFRRRAARVQSGREEGA